MGMSKLKTFLDVLPLKMEKKGGFTRPIPIRPIIMFFVSNHSHTAIFGKDWDDALKSQFSSECYKGRTILVTPGAKTRLAGVHPPRASISFTHILLKCLVRTLGLTGCPRSLPKTLNILPCVSPVAHTL